jgi:arylsulfatase A-like enzyme
MRVVVFAVRGLSAGWVGAYGNEWVETPHLDRVASEAAVFDRHYADRPDADAARRAWRTGVDQTPAGTKPATHSPDLLAALRAAGVRTAVVRANRAGNDGPSDYYAGWDEVFDARPDETALADALPPVLDRLAGSPDWLLWVETDALVPPWDIPTELFGDYFDSLSADEEEADDEPAEYDGDVDPDEDYEGFTEIKPEGELPELTPIDDPPVGPVDRDDLDVWNLLHASFAAAVTALDDALGHIFELLRSRGLDEAAWVVTSDAGFPLGEHGLIGPHRPWLHEELVHLPLMVRMPGGETAGRRVDAFTQPADLLPTLLGLFGVAPPAGVTGFDLRPLWQGADGNRPHAVSAWEVGAAAESAIRTPEWALLLPASAEPDDPPRPPMLFARPDDRWEVTDLRQPNLERAEELAAMLRALVERPET